MKDKRGGSLFHWPKQLASGCVASRCSPLLPFLPGAENAGHSPPSTVDHSAKSRRRKAAVCVCVLICRKEACNQEGSDNCYDLLRFSRRSHDLSDWTSSVPIPPPQLSTFLAGLPYRAGQS